MVEPLEEKLHTLMKSMNEEFDSALKDILKSPRYNFRMTLTDYAETLTTSLPHGKFIRANVAKETTQSEALSTTIAGAEEASALAVTGTNKSIKGPTKRVIVDEKEDEEAMLRKKQLQELTRRRESTDFGMEESMSLDTIKIVHGANKELLANADAVEQVPPHHLSQPSTLDQHGHVHDGASLSGGSSSSIDAALCVDYVPHHLQHQHEFAVEALPPVQCFTITLQLKKTMDPCACRCGVTSKSILRLHLPW